MDRPSTSISLWLKDHPSLGISLMDHLFNRFDGMYLTKWRSAFTDPHSVQNWRETWANGLDEECITLSELKAGVAACREFNWPPSLPEFIKLCRPSVDHEVAFYEAVEQMRLRQCNKDEWTSPHIYWAAQQIGDDLGKYAYVGIQKRWAVALTEARLKIQSGELPKTVPVRLEALPPVGKAHSVTRDAGLEMLRELKRLCQLKTVAPDIQNE